MVNEIWKPVKGFEGMYEVSNSGKVRSIRMKKILKLRKNGGGYYQAHLGFGKKEKYPSLHRIVAIAFIPNPNGYPQINHINGIKTDNRVENLEWCTRSHNMKHAYAIGIKNNKGENHPGHKLTAKNITEIKRSNAINKELAKKFSVSISAISAVRTGQNWNSL